MNMIYEYLDDKYSWLLFRNKTQMISDGKLNIKIKKY